MFFFISTNGQMTWNAFKAWLMSDEATHFLEDLQDRMCSPELGRWLRDGDSLKRRERIARKCVSIAKDDDYLRGHCIFRGDSGDAGFPCDDKCMNVEGLPIRVALTGIGIGRLVDNLPEIELQLREDAGLDQVHVENRRIVMELFRSFLARIRELRDGHYDFNCYSSVMLCLESLPCACPQKKRYDRWFVISYSSNECRPDDDQQSNYLPWAYKTAKNAKAAVKRLAERVVPPNWDRYKIVIDDGSATITRLEFPRQGGYDQHPMEVRLQVEHEPVLVPKDRMIPIDDPPVEDWLVARANDWEMRNLTMEQWLDRIDARRDGSEAAADAAEKCDWWKIDLGRLDQDQWVRVLRYRPELFGQCPFVNDFYDEQWCALLRRQPQFADRFDRWADLPPYLWCFLLRRQPQLVERLTGWDGFDAYCWVRLLKDQPKFSDRCPWEMLSGYDWKELLIARPEFASHCDWGKLSGCDWKELLVARPEYAWNCDKWESISADEWCELLLNRPEFHDKCDWEDFHWDEVSEERWVQLIMRQPQFIETVESPAAVWRKISAGNWVAVLENIPTLANKCDWNAFSEQELVAIVKCQTNLIDFVPRGRIVSRRAWIDLSRHSDVCRRRFLQELDINALDGRVITDILLELPELAEQLPTERIVSEIDKKRLMLLQRGLAEKTFGGASMADCWSNSISWKGRDGMVLGICVKGDLFSLPDTIGPCDAIVVMTIRGRSKQIMQGYEDWKNQNAESHKKVELEVVPIHRVYDDQWGYPPDHYYSINDSDVSKSLNRAFSSLSQLGVRSVAINGINPEGRSFAKLVEDWFLQNSSSISVVYLVDKENAHAFGN